jgi:hypothetical protein
VQLVALVIGLVGLVPASLVLLVYGTMFVIILVALAALVAIPAAIVVVTVFVLRHSRRGAPEGCADCGVGVLQPIGDAVWKMRPCPWCDVPRFAYHQIEDPLG